MSQTMKPIPGAKKLDTGALTPINKGNAHVLKRPDMVAVQLTKEIDADGKPTGPFVEVAGSDRTAAVVASGNLSLMGKALRENRAQFDNLVAATLKCKGGEDYLIQHGYMVEDDSDVIDPNLLGEFGPDGVGSEDYVPDESDLANLESNRGATGTDLDEVDGL